MEHLAHALAEAYGLRLERAERIDYGMWEDSFAIWTDRGRLFAKRFRRKDRKTENILRGLRASEQARAQGFPAPAIVPTRSGELLAAVDEERYYVTAWVEGRTYHPGECPVAAAGAMGAVLGRLHRLLGPASVSPADPLPGPRAAEEACREMLAAYAPHAEPFAVVAQEVLAAQIAALGALPADYAEGLPRLSLGGNVFNSYWVEQLLFHPDGQVAAVVDWSDGAGKPGLWGADVDLGIHLGAFGLEHTAAFVASYQAEHPLPVQEWRAIVTELCYGHLASTNFLGAWLSKPYRRLADWEQTATLWHWGVVERWRRRYEWEACILTAAQTGGDPGGASR